MQANASQKEASEHKDSPLLVIEGPGSRKSVPAGVCLTNLAEYFRHHKSSFTFQIWH